MVVEKALWAVVSGSRAFETPTIARIAAPATPCVSFSSVVTPVDLSSRQHGEGTCPGGARHDRSRARNRAATLWHVNTFAHVAHKRDLFAQVQMEDCRIIIPCRPGYLCEKGKRGHGRAARAGAWTHDCVRKDLDHFPRQSPFSGPAAHCRPQPQPCGLRNRDRLHCRARCSGSN